MEEDLSPLVTAADAMDMLGDEEEASVPVEPYEVQPVESIKAPVELYETG